MTLAVSRPRLGPTLQVTPASAAVAGMVCLMATGTVRPADLATALEALWRPLLTVLSIMVTTAAARRIGVVDRLAHRVFAARSASPAGLFAGVFAFSLVTASVLSNDASILLITPLILTFVRRRYPTCPQLLVPFAFAVFMAAGVAPFVTSNPMNMVVASYVGLNFNQYAVVMLPISIAGSALTFVLLRWVFARELAASTPRAVLQEDPGAFSTADMRMLTLLAGVTATYPLVAVFDGDAIWAVAVAGAVIALWLSWHEGRGSPSLVLRTGVSWDVLVFLPAVFALAIGLQNAGLVDLVSSWYRGAGIGVIGGTAAIGSAVLNNHPMALMNMLALDAWPDASHADVLAALIGGDLGPRLLPTGSLAGLLWIESCRQHGVEISAGRFIRVGVVLTVPALVLSLLLLALA
jgi:arsenical pump membrane protein